MQYRVSPIGGVTFDFKITFDNYTASPGSYDFTMEMLLNGDTVNFTEGIDELLPYFNITMDVIAAIMPPSIFDTLNSSSLSFPSTVLPDSGLFVLCEESLDGEPVGNRTWKFDSYAYLSLDGIHVEKGNYLWKGRSVLTLEAGILEPYASMKWDAQNGIFYGGKVDLNKLVDDVLPFIGLASGIEQDILDHLTSLQDDIYSYFGNLTTWPTDDFDDLIDYVLTFFNGGEIEVKLVDTSASLASVVKGSTTLEWWGWLLIAIAIGAGASIAVYYIYRNVRKDGPTRQMETPPTPPVSDGENPCSKALTKEEYDKCIFKMRQG